MLKLSERFLLDLSNNNTREWFHDNKEQYIEAKTEFSVFVTELIEQMSVFEDLGSVEAKQCIYRINRDVRFSPNKTPYNTHFSAMIARDGRKTKRGPYYFRVKPDGISVIAGGIWEGKAALMNAIREEIDYGLNVFEGILNKESFKKYFSGVHGDSLKRPPKGYEPNHPAIEILKKKQFLAYHEMKKGQYLSKNFDKYLLNGFLEMKPFLDFINTPVDEYYEQI